jgi:hypothetical protein
MWENAFVHAAVPENSKVKAGTLRESANGSLNCKERKKDSGTDGETLFRRRGAR